MKYFTLFVAVYLLAGLLIGCQTQTKEAAKADETKPKQSKLEEFSAQSGRLIEKKYISIGEFAKTSIDALIITDLNSKEVASGVRFEKTISASYTSRTVSAFIDNDEVDGAIKSLNYIKSQVITSAPTADYTHIEYQFISRSGFRLGCYSDKKEWKGAIDISRIESDDIEAFKSSELDALSKLLEQAKAKLPKS